MWINECRLLQNIFNPPPPPPKKKKMWLFLLFYITFYSGMKTIENEPELILNNDESMCVYWESNSSISHFDTLNIDVQQNSFSVLQFSHQIENQVSYSTLTLHKNNKKKDYRFPSPPKNKIKIDIYECCLLLRYV